MIALNAVKPVTFQPYPTRSSKLQFGDSSRPHEPLLAAMFRQAKELIDAHNEDKTEENAAVSLWFVENGVTYEVTPDALLITVTTKYGKEPHRRTYLFSERGEFMCNVSHYRLLDPEGEFARLREMINDGSLGPAGEFVNDYEWVIIEELAEAVQELPSKRVYFKYKYELG